jgi:mRNA interferase MazF
VAETIQRGTIIWAELSDPNGRNAKPRPAVVLSTQPHIDTHGDLVVAVITTDFTHPLPSGWFAIPTMPGGHAITGLDQACVVKATWLKQVPRTQVQAIMGRAPSRVVREILNFLAQRHDALKDFLS